MNELTGWWVSHGALIGACWVVLSAIVNIAIRFKKVEDWIAFGEKYPATAAVIRIVRALGVDPVKAVNAATDAINIHAERFLKK